MKSAIVYARKDTNNNMKEDTYMRTFIYYPARDIVYGANLEELARGAVDAEEFVISGGAVKHKDEVTGDEHIIEVPDQPVFGGEL